MSYWITKKKSFNRFLLKYKKKKIWDQLDVLWYIWFSYQSRTKCYLFEIKFRYSFSIMGVVWILYTEKYNHGGCSEMQINLKLNCQLDLLMARGCFHIMSAKTWVCRPPLPPLAGKIRNWPTLLLPPCQKNLKMANLP